MTVSNQTPYVEYTANGSTTNFALTFDCDNPDNLIVKIDGIEVIDTWTLQGSTVVFITAPIANSIVSIERNTPLERTTNYQTYDDSFSPKPVNKDFDSIWHVLQEFLLKIYKNNYKYQELIDQLIAGDINGLPAEILARIAADENLQENIDIEKLRAYAAEQNINTAMDTEKVRVNSELANRYTKQEAYNRSEVDASITAVSAGHKAYATLAAAQAAQATFPANIIVEITDDGTNNGAWRWNGTTLTKSPYDPLTQAKSYTDTVVTPVNNSSITNSLLLNRDNTIIGVSSPTGNGTVQQNGSIGTGGQIYVNEDIKTTRTGVLKSVTLNLRTTGSLIKFVFLSKITSSTWKIEKIVDINCTGFSQYSTVTFYAGVHFTATNISKDWYFGTYRDTAGTFVTSTIIADTSKTTLRAISASTISEGATVSNIGNLYQSAIQINVETSNSIILDTVNQNMTKVTSELTSAKPFIGLEDFRNTPLEKLASKIKSGAVVKTLSMGTSIANNSNSSVNKFEAALVRKFGKVAELSQCLGEFGGGVTGNYNGWLRQDFGGTKFLRLNGKPTSSAFSIKCAGDKFKFWYSKEIGGSSFTLNVDGTDYTIDCSGTSQSYRNLFELTLENKGHVITFNPPTSGDVYVEWLEVWDSTKAGLVVRNATLGGSALAQTRNRSNTTGNPVIATVGNNGIDSFFQDDVDLAIIEWHVNDAGSGSYVSSGQYFTDLTYLVGKYVAAKIPVIVITELSGHYRMPSNTYFESYKTAKKAIQRQAQMGVWVIDWDGMYRTDEYVSDIGHFCRSFYTATYDDSNNTYTGDFIHPTNVGYRGLDLALKNVTKIDVPNDSLRNTELAKVYQLPNFLDMQPIIYNNEVLNAKSIARRIFESGYFKQTIYVSQSAVNVQQSWKDSTITASTLSDDFGKYASPILSGSIIGKIFYMTQGEYWVTFKTSGFTTIRLYKDVGSILFNNKETLSTGLVELPQQNGYPLEGEQPIYYTMKVKIVAAGNLEIRFGRIYDLCITKIDLYDLPVVTT